MKWTMEFESDANDKVGCKLHFEEEVNEAQLLRAMGLSVKCVMHTAKQTAQVMGISEEEMVAAMDKKTPT